MGQGARSVGAFIESLVGKGVQAVSMVEQLETVFSGFRSRAVDQAMMKAGRIPSFPALKCVYALNEQLGYCSKDIGQLDRVLLGVNQLPETIKWLCESGVLDSSDVKGEDDGQVEISCLHALDLLRRTLGWQTFDAGLFLSQRELQEA